MKKLMIASVAFLACTPCSAQGVAGKAARETFEYLAKKFGREVAEVEAERLSARIASAAARYGDDALVAVRKVGPKALALADEAGDNAPRVLRLLGRHGDDAAHALARPGAMKLFARYGDDAAEALIRHKGVAEPVVASLGKPAISALKSVGPRGGKRLAMMAQAGELSALGRTSEVLAVVGRHGDRAMEFIWKHKGPLTTLAAFLADPEPFIDGTRDIAHVGAEQVVRPTIEAAGDVARTTVSFIGWALMLVLAIIGGLLVWAGRSGLLGKVAGHAVAAKFKP